MDVLKKQAFVHTGMFAGWLVEHGMIHREFLAAAKRFKRKQITGPPGIHVTSLAEAKPPSSLRDLTQAT